MTLYTSRTIFCTLYVYNFRLARPLDSALFKYSCTDSLGPSWTLDTYLLYFIYTCVYIFRLLLILVALGSTSNARCMMQPPPIDIPLPRQTSSFHSSDSSAFGQPSPDPFDELSTTPVASTGSRNRSRRITTAPRSYALPSGNQPNRPELTRQWSLFGQLMEIEGLPSSNGSTNRPNSDGNMSVREHDASSPGLSPRRLLSSSFHTQYSVEPASDDAPFLIHPITSEPDSLSSSAASLDVPSRPTQSYLPFWPPTFTNTHRNVLKCAIAYFIASLFTFSPHLSRFISDLSSYGPNDPTTPSPSGHMVATMYDT